MSGTLPTGLALSTAGIISGTPNATGTFTFTVQVGQHSVDRHTVLHRRGHGPQHYHQLSALARNCRTELFADSHRDRRRSSLCLDDRLGLIAAGLSLSASGVITGIPATAGTSNFSVKLTDAALNSTTQAFTLIVGAAPPLVRSGVLAHIAAGGPPDSMWTTTIYLANTSSNQVTVALSMHGDDGNALVLPMTVTQQGAAQAVTASS